MRTALHCLPDQERDDVLKFFTEYLETRLGDISQRLDYFIYNVQYDHDDILERVIKPIEEFLQDMQRLFKALAEEEEYAWKKRQVTHVIQKEKSIHEVTNRGRTNRLEPRIKPKPRNY